MVGGNFFSLVRPLHQGVLVDNALLRAADYQIHQKWEDCSGKTLWKLNCLAYAGTVIVKRVVKHSIDRLGGGGCPRVKSIRQKEAGVSS